MLDYKQFETLDIAARRKLARRMKRLTKQSSFKMKKARSFKRRAGMEKLQKRARKEAKMKVIKKFMGDIDYKEMPLQKRMQIDKQIVQKKQALINKIAKRLIPQKRKAESERIKKLRSKPSE